MDVLEFENISKWTVFLKSLLPIAARVYKKYKTLLVLVSTLTIILGFYYVRSHGVENEVTVNIFLSFQKNAKDNLNDLHQWNLYLAEGLKAEIEQSRGDTINLRNNFKITSEQFSTHISANYPKNNQAQIVYREIDRHVQTVKQSMPDAINIALSGHDGPSKKMVFVLFPSVGLTLITYIILFIREASISYPHDFDEKEYHIGGELPRFRGPTLNLKEHLPEIAKIILTKLLVTHENPQVILITSVSPQDGKTLLLLQTAYAASMYDKKVIIMDCQFGTKKDKDPIFSTPAIGLSDYLFNPEVDIQTLLGETQYVLTAGQYADEGLSYAHNPKFKILLDKLKEDYDHIFIEGSNASSADVLYLAKQVDAIWLVGRLNSSNTFKIKQAYKKLKEINKHTSIIFNRV